MVVGTLVVVVDNHVIAVGNVVVEDIAAVHIAVEGMVVEDSLIVGTAEEDVHKPVEGVERDIHQVQELYKQSKEVERLLPTVGLLMLKLWNVDILHWFINFTNTGMRLKSNKKKRKTVSLKLSKARRPWPMPKGGVLAPVEFDFFENIVPPRCFFLGLFSDVY